MQIQLSIMVLVSDRAETANKCLSSLVPILQQLPSELIVVYTGSSSDSIEVAKKYTDHIIPFTWCNDFSKARNAGLDEATGEWFMFIDDDEWFESCQEIIEFFKTGEYRDYNSAEYLVRNYFDLNGTSYSDAHVTRMAKRISGCRFVGIVHEAISPLFSPTKYFKCFAHHYGYAVGNKDKKIASHVRNIPLLEKQIELQPDNVRYYVQLAQEYYVSEDYKKAESYCRKVLEKSEYKWSSNYVQWSAAYLVGCLSVTGRHEDTLKEGDKLLSSPGLEEIFQMYIYLMLSPACPPLEEYEKGVEFARNFILLRKKLDASPKLWDEQQLLHINKSSIQKISYLLFSNAILCASQLEDFETVDYLIREFLWDGECGQDKMYVFMEGYKKIYPAYYDKILAAFVKLDSSNRYVLLQKALYYELKKDYKQVEDLYYQCQISNEGDYLDQLILMALRNRFALPAFMDKMDLDEWRCCAQSVAENYVIENYFVETEEISPLFVPYPIHKIVLVQKILARVLYMKGLTQKDFIKALDEYCDAVMELNHMLYKDELFSGSLQFCLPKECRASILIEKVLAALKKGEIIESIDNIKELIHGYPGLSYIARRITDYISEEFSEYLESKANKEFYETGQKVKAIMKKLADDEKYNEALTVAEELGNLLPKDTEIIKYKQQLRRMVDCTS